MRWSARRSCSARATRTRRTRLPRWSSWRTASGRWPPPTSSHCLPRKGNAVLTLSAAIAGLLTGGAYALMGLSTLLTYRLVSVVNFAPAAVGAFGAFAMVTLYEQGLPLVLAVLAGLAVGASMH